MKLLLTRLYDSGADTLGVLHYRDKAGDVKYLFILEDEFRIEKVKSETRIAEGFYEIQLKKAGRVYERYCRSSIEPIRSFTHKWGVIELMNVPDFDGILIHSGNTHRDTAGCLLVGDVSNNNSNTEGFISYSINAYVRLIEAMNFWLDKGEIYCIEIRDYDREIERTI